jgi:hypothetical protein
MSRKLSEKAILAESTTSDSELGDTPHKTDYAYIDDITETLLTTKNRRLI